MHFTTPDFLGWILHIGLARKRRQPVIGCFNRSLRLYRDFFVKLQWDATPALESEAKDGRLKCKETMWLQQNTDGRSLPSYMLANNMRGQGTSNKQRAIHRIHVLLA